MADTTAAARQRRHRAHKRGDHGLCDAERCDALTGALTASAVPAAPVTRDVTAVTPQLGVRGQRLWQQVHAAGGKKLGPAELVLLEEACRIADRLDRLDAVLRGDVDTWMRLVEDVDAGEITLFIDKALAEARQQAVALKQLVVELRQGGAKDQPAGNQGGDLRDQLAARRAQRLADAAGR